MMEQVQTGFLILHYKNFEITDRCISSILDLDEGETAKIIVVDNGSCNGSAKRLSDKYENNPMIDILVLEKGNGFSRGNNLGYEYIRKHYCLDFLVAANNDILFTQKDFIALVKSEYRKYGFVILGMDMIDTRSGAHLNPKYKAKSAQEIREWIRQLELRKKRGNVRAVMTYLFQQSGWYQKYVKHIRNRRPDVSRQRKLSSRYAADRVIQGGCMVFSKLFLEKEEHLFWPETQFYCEEDILFERSRKHGWKILYSPKLCVLHEQGASFRADRKSIREKLIEGINYNLASAKILLKELEG